MDGSAFDRLTKTLTESRTRRGLSRLLGGVAMGGSLTLLGLAESAAKKKKVTLCHQGQTISVSKKAKKKHLKHGDTLGACPTSPPALQAAYTCPVSPQGNVRNVQDNRRLAQTFVASRSGTLQQIQFEIFKGSPPGGDYVVQLLRVTEGVPGSGLGDILATVSIPDASVPSGGSTLVATYNGPALQQGTEYAAAITRTNAAVLSVLNREANGEACSGQAFATPTGGSGAFAPNVTPIDLMVSVLVV